MTGDREDPGLKPPLVAAEATHPLGNADPSLGGQVLTHGPGGDPEVTQQRGLDVPKEAGEARVIASASAVEHLDELGAEHAAYRLIPRPS